MQYHRIIGEQNVRIVVEMGLGSCVEEWLHAAGKLSRFGGVLLYERYGINRSRDNGQERTPLNIAMELRALLEEVPHTDKIVLVAHSQGGLYAGQFARLYPEMVEALVLTDPLSPRDSEFRTMLTEKEYVQSGVDKSKNILIMKRMSRMGLGFLVRKIMKNAPPICYSEHFTREDIKSILKSYTKIKHLRNSYSEYEFSHVEENVKELADAASFPELPIMLITHDSEIAIAESMEYGGNSREFAEKIEKMWQDMMKGYLDFSSNSRHCIAEGCGHYIHLQNPDFLSEKICQILGVDD